MQAIARLNQFDPNGFTRFEWVPGQSLATIVREAGLPEWFLQHGEIRVARHGRWCRYEPSMWPHVKPKSDTFLELRAQVQNGKGGKLFIALAAIALTIATAGIGAGALGGVLGSAFGAGTLGASLAAAGVGIAGQMLLRALTPAPSSGDGSSAVGQELRQAGVASNDVQRGGPIAGVLGRFAFAPQHLIPPYVTMEKGRLWCHAMVGCWGRNLVQDIKINGTAISEINEIQYEVFEGDGSGRVSFLSNRTCLSDAASRGVTLKGYIVSEADGVKLSDQVIPDNSIPSWQVFRTNGIVDQAIIRVQFPSPLTDATGAAMSMPFRIEVRKVGDTIWRKLPTLHVVDYQQQGPFRIDFRLIWKGKVKPRFMVRMPTNDWYRASLAFYKTSPGQTYEYTADPYFAPSGVDNAIALALTSNVLGGITVSASQNNVDAWKAISGAFWPSSGAGSWWQIDWGAGNSKTIKRFQIGTGSAAGTRPGDFTMSGSQDGVNWTELMDNEGEVLPDNNDLVPDFNINNDTAWRFYRLNFAGNSGAATGAIELAGLVFYTNHRSWWMPLATNATDIFANNVAAHRDGFDILMQGDEGWPAGEYDIRIKRGAAFKTSLFTYGRTSYSYSSGSYFFDRTNTSPYTAPLDQKTVNASAVVEDFISISSAAPINPDIEPLLTRIAVRVPEMQLTSISATFTSYAREWNGSVWADTPVPTRNPAALARDALLRVDVNASPLPGEILDEISHEAFFVHCQTNGFTCDAVVRDISVADVMRLCGSVARASPRQSDMWGWVIDRNRSAEPITALLTPETSRDLGTDIAYENVPHGLRVTYFDESDSWQQKEVEVYRPGFTSDSATDIQSMNYNGITSLAKATAQATYDLRQMHHRKITYRREVGIEARSYARGEKIGIADDVLARHAYFGLIKTVITSAGNVTGLVLFGLARLSESASQITMSQDVSTIGDIATTTGTFAAAIRLKNGDVITSAIVETADTSAITFTVPIADTGQFDVAQPVAIGPLGRHVTNAILHHKEKTGEEAWALTLLPEANEIFA